MFDEFAEMAAVTAPVPAIELAIVWYKPRNGLVTANIGTIMLSLNACRNCSTDG